MSWWNHPWDVIVSDIGLSDGSGFDLMRQARASGLQIPAVALSGCGMEPDVARAKEAGFTAHLTKPVDVARLESVVSKLLGTEPSA